jgi:hypothetical protein
MVPSDIQLLFLFSVTTSLFLQQKCVSLSQGWLVGASVGASVGTSVGALVASLTNVLDSPFAPVTSVVTVPSVLVLTAVTMPSESVVVTSLPSLLVFTVMPPGKFVLVLPSAFLEAG